MPFENNQLKDISLTSEEKSALRARLELFMRDHPLPVPSDTFYGVRSPFHIAPLQMVRVMFSAVAILALVGGSVAAAAERSLPGDVLYSVKVNVNEEVRSAVAVSPIAKASWDAKRAQRRLEEAEKLAVEGRLDADTSARLEAKFTEHAEKSSARAEESNDAAVKAAVHSDLEATLEAHGSVIRTLIEDNEELEKELGGVQAAVTERAEAAEDARRASEEELSASTTAYSIALLEEQKEFIEEKIDEIDDAYRAVRKQLNPLLSREINDRLDDAERIYKKAEKSLEKEDLSKALNELQDSLRMTTEAEVLLSVSVVLMPEEEGEEVEGVATSTDPAATSSIPAGTELEVPPDEPLSISERESDDGLPSELLLSPDILKATPR